MTEISPASSGSPCEDPRFGRYFYQEPFVPQKALGIKTFSGLVIHVIEATGISEAAETLENGTKEHPVSRDKKAWEPGPPPG